MKITKVEILELLYYVQLYFYGTTSHPEIVSFVKNYDDSSVVISFV